MMDDRVALCCLFSTAVSRSRCYPHEGPLLRGCVRRWCSMKGMNTISTLVRANIQQLSGGRISSIVEIDGEPIRLIASARRQKTISASVRDGMIQLAVPSTMRDQDIVTSARGLIAKIKSQQRASQRFQSNPALYARAIHLAKVWLNGEVQPNSVVWSDRQTTRWGSCTTATKSIRISTMLRGMPQWVIDGVLIHELAHLKYPGHGDDFKAFTRRYPRMQEADAFLDGVAFAQHRDQHGQFPSAYD